MRCRWAYIFEHRESPVDVLALAAFFQAHGLMLRNPGNGKLTRLSDEGDQIEATEAELADLIQRNSGVPFQWWIDDGFDVFCQFDNLPDGTTRRRYETGVLDEQQLIRFCKMLTAYVVQHPGSVGAIVEPLNYAEFSADEWTAFFWRSEPPPTWPQTLVCQWERLKTIGAYPSEYEITVTEPWRILQFPSYLVHPLRLSTNTKNFDAAVSDFKRFIIQQDYPPNLLWLQPDDILFWGLRYYFRKGDPSERANTAKTEYERALDRNVGLALQAEFKTERWAICRVYVPPDELEAERRMIPKTGVKIAATVDPKPAVEVHSRLRWRILKWLVRKSSPCWN
ncbi:MAG TPA: hypothetical protein VG456_02540 [Candidatus Sulfopaludibacter sp.]|jgi:hypothetical protein|nr:hypothetical protein [Candidatus Sulfopaludibacter sp.]